MRTVDAAKQLPVIRGNLLTGAPGSALVVPALFVGIATAGCNLIFGIEPGERAETAASTSADSGGSTSGTGGGSTSGTGGGSGAATGGGGESGCAPSDCIAGQCPSEEMTPGYTHETKGMVVHRDRVLWANEVAIDFISTDGGALGTLSGTSGFGSTIWVAVSGGQLSWSNYSDGIVRGLSLDSPSPIPFVIADIPPQGGNPVQAQYGRIAAFGDTVYWATNEPNAIWRAKADGTGPFEQIAAPGWPFGVAADATHVYWADALANQIARKPTAAVGAPEEVFAAVNGRPTEIALVNGELFWVTDGGAVQSKPTSSPLASQPHTYTVDPMVISKSITADDSFVYWTVYRNEHENGQGEVRRAHRGGDDMTTLTTGRPYFFEISTDCGFIYWNVNNLEDGAPGTVFRMAKPRND